MEMKISQLVVWSISAAVQLKPNLQIYLPGVALLSIKF